MEDIDADLLASIYAAGMDSAGWPIVLEQLVARIDGAMSACCLTPLSPHGDIFVTTATFAEPAGYVAAYRTHFQRMDKAGAALLQHFCPGYLIFPNVDALWPRREFVRSAIFNDLISVHGFEDITGIAVGESRKQLFTISVYGPHWTSASASRNGRVLAALQPHLAKSVALYWRLTRLEDHIAAAAATIDSLRTGVIWLDRHRRVLWMNVAAERLIAAGDGTVSRCGTGCSRPVAPPKRPRSTLPS